MADEAKRDDGVNRNGLDYRAGYVEGLAAFLNRMMGLARGAKQKESEGMQKSFDLAKQLREEMLDKMRGGSVKE